ncbi:hypothetical protein PQX77_011587 [Marasmius sp. AFHP31]|nr:hypothetical protein PQX77_018847 [Marasmius sp. AFHP31]KAK1219613.1 hypothetical protein PQX77_017660 [Marasmius sp. AFHP31]KAK1225474.1 hypothetical protein PQX77_011587 [Marasmius sp. AFHP31]
MVRTVGVKKGVAAKYNVVVPASTMPKQRRTKRPKRPSMTCAERERRRNNRKSNYVKMKLRIGALRRYVQAECAQMGLDFDRKTRYFLDMFFQGGVRVSKPANEVNDFNAFKSNKAYELRKAGGPVMTIQEIQEAFKHEYDAQTPAERQKGVEEYKARRDLDTRERLKYPSIKEKIADSASSVSQITGVLKGLKERVGIEAVVLVVKNRPEKIMKPQWIFTDPRIQHYLPTIVRGWNTGYIGKKVEALAVAGCDPTKIVKSPREQADALKTECSQLIQEALDEACLTQDVLMQYEQFDKRITLRYRVVCEGWPKGLSFQKPSSFSQVDDLLRLRDAWRDGHATFRKLDDSEFDTWREGRDKGIEEGTVVIKERKKCCDAGTKRGSKGKAKETGKGKAKGVESAEDDSNDSDGASAAGMSGGAEIASSPEQDVQPQKAAGPKKKKAPPKAKYTKRVDITVLDSANTVDDTPDTPSVPPAVTTLNSATTTPDVATTTPDASHPRPKPRPFLSQRPGSSLGPNASTTEFVGPTAAVAELEDNAVEGSASRVGASDFDIAVIDPQLRDAQDPVQPSSNEVVPADSESPCDVVATPSSQAQAPEAGQGKKRKEPVSTDAVPTRSRRPRVPTSKRHLGASTHPATRRLGRASEAEDL